MHNADFGGGRRGYIADVDKGYWGISQHEVHGYAPLLPKKKSIKKRIFRFATVSRDIFFKKSEQSAL